MDDSFSYATEHLLSWLVERGVKISESMALVDLRADGRGRGVVATRDIAEDEVIFSIPRSAVLNVRNTSAGGSIAGAEWADMPPWLSLAALMMNEAALGSSSAWFPYFSALPSKLDSLVFWSPEELSELQASTVINKIGKAGAEEHFNARIKKLGITGGSIDVFHHMASLIMAYAFDIPENPTEGQNETDDELVDDDEEKTMLTMIPLADMLNADADRNNARLMCDSEDLEMRAITVIAQGDEIFNDYGQLPRSDLLRRYGYITDNYKPYDVTEISHELIVSAFQPPSSAGHTFRDNQSKVIEPLDDNVLQARLELARREDVYDESYDIVHGDADGPCLPDELLALVWILSINDETFSALEKSESFLPGRSKLSTSFVGSVLVQILKLREQEYATTLQEDAAIIAAGNLPYRLSMAVQVRHGEKEILREAIQEAETFQADNKKMRSEKGNEKAKRSRDGESSSISKKKRKY